MRSSSHTYALVCGTWANRLYSAHYTYISKVPIQNFDITVDDFKRDEFVIARRDAADEEEGGVAAVYDFGVCFVD